MKYNPSCSDITATGSYLQVYNVLPLSNTWTLALSLPYTNLSVVALSAGNFTYEYLGTSYEKTTIAITLTDAKNSSLRQVQVYEEQTMQQFQLVQTIQAINSSTNFGASVAINDNFLLIRSPARYPLEQIVFYYRARNIQNQYALLGTLQHQYGYPLGEHMVAKDGVFLITSSNYIYIYRYDSIKGNFVGLWTFSQGFGIGSLDFVSYNTTYSKTDFMVVGCPSKSSVVTYTLNLTALTYTSSTSYGFGGPLGTTVAIDKQSMVLLAGDPAIGGVGMNSMVAFTTLCPQNYQMSRAGRSATCTICGFTNTSKPLGVCTSCGTPPANRAWKKQPGCVSECLQVFFLQILS